MQLQICMLYLRTAWWKAQGQKWLDGTAVYYVVRLDSYRRLGVPARLRTTFCFALATYGTLAFEGGFGFFVWIKVTRYPVLLAGVALHLLVEVFMNLQLFGWTVLTTYLLFVPPTDAQAALTSLIDEL
jgi:hypothetical protein